MLSRRILLAFGVGAPMLSIAAQARPFPKPAWPSGADAAGIVDRFPVPEGFKRLNVADDGFGAWLRQLPLRPPGEPVRFHDGRIKPDQSGAAAVIDIDVGRGDLQQCADAIIRLRAEYLRAVRPGADLAFRFTSGDRFAYADWLAGRRPVVRGNKVAWESVGATSDTYAGFRRWLDVIFTYAGTMSLQRELRPVRDAGGVEPGDVLIQPGTPGHAVVVIDVAVGISGERRALLAQSFMPAQSIHVLNNPAGGTWYRLAGERRIVTPEWTFAPGDLRRFPA